MRQRLLETQMFLLKGPCMNLLRLTPSEIQCWGSRSKDTRDIWGGTELTGISMRAGGAAFSQTEVLAEASHCSFSELTPNSELAGTCHI